jgi:hypothetical protein
MKTNWFLFDKEEEDDDVVVDEVIVGQILARKRSRRVKSNALKKIKGPPPLLPNSWISYYVYIYIYRERERERENHRGK